MSGQNNWQEEAMRRLRQMQSTGGRGGGGPQMPKAAGGAMIGGFLLLGGVYALSNSLFNVDGGQRAIKYKRFSGVSKEIYNEGLFDFTGGHDLEPGRSIVAKTE